MIKLDLELLRGFGLSIVFLKIYVLLSVYVCGGAHVCLGSHDASSMGSYGTGVT